MVDDYRPIDRTLSFSSKWDQEAKFQQKARKGLETISSDPLFVTDIAQSRYFTVSLTGFPKLQVPQSKDLKHQHQYTPFLPVKNIDLTYTNYNNLSIPVSIFGDFPLLNRKSVSTMRLTCYDMGSGDVIDEIEKALRTWEDECFPGNYVAYLSDIIRTLEYVSYSVDGKISLQRWFNVIPAGSTSVNRSYEEDGAKLITFSVIAVGESGGSGHVEEEIFGSIVNYSNPRS